MKRQEILKEIKEYFNVQELVSPQVHRRYRKESWQFISTDLLECLLIIRKSLGKPIIINNWATGGRFTQRGLRDNLTPIFKKKFKINKLYLSGHVLGMAIDFDVLGMTAIEVREWLVNNSDILPCKIRLERNLNDKPISWVHLDVKHEETNPKVYLFDV